MSIPIVGNPFELVRWYPTVLLRCKVCQAGEIVVVIGGIASACMACGATFDLTGYACKGQPIQPTDIGLSITTRKAQPKGEMS